MNKGKGLFGITSRTRSRASRVTENHDGNQLWEDGAIFAGEKLVVNPTRWHDLIVLDHWGMKEDFTAFMIVADLLDFSHHPRETYEEISQEFLSTFRFEGRDIHKRSKKSKPPPPTFVFKFSMKGQRLCLSLDGFCKAIRVENRGSWDEVHADTNQELVNFWRSICVNVPERLNRGKFTHIHHPALRCIALILARGFLAGDNTSA
jgi:hypothetical protein